MNQLITIFLFCLSNLCGQDKTIKISTSSLDSAYLNYQKREYLRLSQKLSIDMQSILISFISDLVINDRKIRYQWDKRSFPKIYIYKHLINFDSVHFFRDHALKFNSESKRKAIDTSLFLFNISFPDVESRLYDYTKLSCFENFDYSFVFVDNILKADFVVSIFKQDENNPIKNLYIWYIPNLTTNSIFYLRAEQPWDDDCFKVKVIEKNTTEINIGFKEIGELQKFRNSR